MSVSRDQLLVIGERLAVPHPSRQLGRCSRHDSNSYIPIVVLHALL